MKTEFERIREIFLAIVDRPSAESETLLNVSCGNDPELRRQVVVLLEAHAKDHGILDRNGARRAPSNVHESIERPGAVIGPYTLLEQIGEGGMGTVFMAEQTHPVRRTVALKVIKPGMDTRQVIARFEAERQALAMMEHLNIARVLDAGATDTGRPFFVMELVHGVPISKYCDDNQLTPRERLELFVPVCQAIQHAHQKGIIHRDIKPSNVMVTLYDGKPVPKIIDFGVAKATEQPLTEQTLFTQYGTMVGTLEYMSPEQAEMSAVGADTRSDIYSLGVLLYELLTGSTPLSHKRVREAAYGEVLRMIREEEPPKPSTRLSDSGETLASISAQRHMEPGKLTKLVRGELDWIVMKCLEKDRNRRYETANGLARDIERFLRDEPVQASPPSVTYRFRKFARRHKAGVASAGLILIFLVVLGSGAGWMVRDRAERWRAVEREVNEALQWQEQEKWTEALAAVRRAEVLLPDVRGDVVLHERVRDAHKDLDMVLRLEGIMHKLTALESNALSFDFAKRDNEYAGAFREYGIDVDALDQEESANLISGRYIRFQLALALDAWAEARRFAYGLRGKGCEGLLAVACAVDPDPWRVRVREALRNRNRAVLQEAAEQIPIDNVPPITLGLLGRALKDAGDLDQAEALFRRAQRRHPDSFWLNFDLASSLMAQQPPALQEAVRFMSVALALRPDSWPARAGLCDALQRQGKLHEVIAELSEAIELDSNHAALWIKRGSAFDVSRNFDKAIADYSRAIELDPTNALAWSYRGNSYHYLHQYDQAIANQSKAIELSPANAWIWSCRGVTHESSRHYDKAIADYSRAIELDPSVPLTHNGLAWLLAACADAKFRNPAQAVEQAQKAVELAPRDGKFWNTLGVARYRAGDWKAAVAALEKSMELRQGGASFDWFFLAMACWKLGDKDEALKWYQQACKWMDKNNPADEELKRFRTEAATLLEVNGKGEGEGTNNKGEAATSLGITMPPLEEVLPMNS